METHPYVSFLALLPALVLFCWVGYASPGFDDEYYTINWVTGAETPAILIGFIDNLDVHPPGSYLIVWSLRELGLSFSEMRLLAGGLSAFALWVLWRNTLPAAPLGQVVGYLLICVNPTLVLWGATLRWFSWSLPLIVLIFLLVRGGFRNSWVHWGAFGLLGVVLAYIGYFNLLLVPGLLVYALWRRRDRLAREWPAIVSLAALSLLALYPQLVGVMPDQMGRGMSVHDSKGMFRRVAGVFLHVFAGHSAMPLGFAAILFALTNFVLFAAAAWHRRLALGTPAALTLFPALALAFLGGLTGHFRSMVVLVPLQAVWQTTIFPRDGRFARLLAAGFLVATLAGLWNVVTHSDTSKGGWNAPYWKAIDWAETEAAGCDDPAIFTYDPVLTWQLTQRGNKVLTVRRWDPQPGAAVRSHEGCLIVVRTFHRMLNAAFNEELATALAPRGAPDKTVEMGFDRHAWFKRKFDRRIPDQAIVIEMYTTR